MNISSTERQLFEKLHDSRELSCKVFNTRAFSGFWKSIIEKYPEKAHFVYELLQNADDAEATEAEMILGDKELIFKHNGKVGFSISDEDDVNVPFGHINSITAVGNSEKPDDISNKIGKFGVGFKAVFIYTEEPRIYDDKFSFSITSKIVPNLLEKDYPGRKKGETVFVFPFINAKKAYVDIEERLKLLEHPILFLHHLKKFSWSYSDKKTKYIYEKTEQGLMSCGDLTCNMVEVKDGSKASKILMSSKTLTIKGSGSHQIFVGFYLKDDGTIDTDIRPNIHCFFPTKETFDQCFISHAPFELTDGRHTLKEDSEVNRMLINEIASMAAKSLIFLRDYKKIYNKTILNHNLFKIIPIQKTYNYSKTYNLFDKNLFYESYKNFIEENDIILTKSGSYISVYDAIVCTPIYLATLLKQDMLVELGYSKKCDFVSTDIAKLYSKDFSIEYYLEKFDISNLTSKLFAQKLHADFFKKRDIKWIERFYSYLMRDARSLWNLSDDEEDEEDELVFRTAPIIKSQNGSWIPPFLPNGDPYVYLPISKGSKTGYNFVDKELAKNEVCKKFLKELGISKPSEEDYIKKVILARHARVDCDFSKEELVEDLELICNHFFSLNQTDRSRFADDIYGMVRLLDTHNKGILSEGIYDASDPRFKLFIKNIEDAKLLNLSAYKPIFERHGRNETLAFLHEIGVEYEPCIKKIEKERSYIYAYKYNLSQTQQNTLNSIKCTYYIDLTDYIIEGFDAVINNTNQFTTELSKYLCECLSGYNRINCYKYLTLRYYYRTTKNKYCDSSLYYQLKNTPWLDGKKPEETSREALQQKGYNVSKELCEFLGIREKEQTLSDLGATKEQIEREHLGSIAEEYGVKDEFELRKILEIYRHNEESAIIEKGSRQHRNMSGEIWGSRDEDGTTDIQPGSANSGNNSTNKNNGQQRNASHDDIVEEEPVNAPFVGREELANPSVDTMFHNNERHASTPSLPSSKTTSEKVEELTKRMEEDERREKEIIDLQELADRLPKYSAKWFETLLQLEYQGSTKEFVNKDKKSLSISFSRVLQEPESDRIYVLKNPSRNIPLWLEEVGGISVSFLFNDREETKFNFEVGNVRDYTLRLKAKAIDASDLAKIDWTKCTRATINVNNPIELIGTLKDAFKELSLADGFNLKSGLADIENLKFVFGPPGTGKTTWLSDKISSIIEESRQCKILVLTPTNKACDVLASKLLDQNKKNHTWLGRFVATGDEYLEDMGIVVDRESEMNMMNKFCLISTMARLPFDGFIGKYCQRLMDIDWDYVICDESSMIPLVQMMLAVYRFKKSKIIIAGDPMQIGPIVREPRWQDENIYTMIKLNKFDNPKTEPVQFRIENLPKQYRSLPAIGELFSKYAYDGKLIHHRSLLMYKKPYLGEIDFNQINFISFKVEKYDSIFGAKKLDGSNVHIYSALLTVETCLYVARSYASKEQEVPYNIGIICPYAPQAQLVERLIEQQEDLPTNVNISVGTIHSFQGDECDMILALMNPPTGMKGAADKIFLNRQNIINVAISRAKNILCVIMPHCSTEGYENLYELNRLGYIASKDKNSVNLFTCDEIEETIFGKKFFLENNTFVTSHQLANVYTKPVKRYEVRIDESSIDIQIGQSRNTGN